MAFEQSNLAMAEAVHKGLSLLVATSNEILVDVVEVTRGIPEFFESRLGFVMCS